MYKHILIPTDGSKLAEAAVQHGIAFAKEIGAKITALTVSEPFHIIAIKAEVLEDSSASYKQRTGERAARILGAVANAAKAAGVTCETVHVQEEHPYKAIIDTAKSQQCDLIVMASHGRRGISAIVLGSETVKVLTHSKTPVLVYRWPPDELGLAWDRRKLHLPLVTAVNGQLFGRPDSGVDMAFDFPALIAHAVTELAIREVIHGRPIRNTEALANPEVLNLYRDLPDLQRG